MRTFDGHVYGSFQETCLAQGLIENDNHWSECLKEAGQTGNSFELRMLFVIILLHGDAAFPLGLWMDYKSVMCDDILYRKKLKHIDTVVENLCLMEIEEHLIRIAGRKLSDFNLPSVDKSLLQSVEINKNISPTMSEDELTHSIAQLNEEQAKIFHIVMKSINNNEGKIVFVDAPGGTGKTFMLNLIIHKLRMLGK